MSNIKSKSQFEIRFLKKLSKEIYPKGYRYRKHYSKLPGKPDIVFIKQGVAIFLDGDFWHGRELRRLKQRPIGNYWIIKITNNKARDKKYNALLQRMGWKILRLWESDIETNPNKAISHILNLLERNCGQAGESPNPGHQTCHPYPIRQDVYKKSPFGTPAKTTKISRTKVFQLSR